MLERRSANRPIELAIPAPAKVGSLQKPQVQVTQSEPESPAIDFGNFKSNCRLTVDISDEHNSEIFLKEFGMLDLPQKERLLSVIPETKSALEDQSQIASNHTQSPTSPPYKQPVEISSFAPVKQPLEDNDSGAEYPVSIVMSSLLVTQQKEKSGQEPQLPADRNTKNLKVKEPFSKLSSRVQPTVFTHSEEEQSFPQRKLRMCSAENEITHFLSGKHHGISNT